MNAGLKSGLIPFKGRLNAGLKTGLKTGLKAGLIPSNAVECKVNARWNAG